MSRTKGSIPAIIRNTTKRYEGNLVHYFQVLFAHGQNLNNPYHNFRHICHVLWLCHSACVYYAHELSLREKRNLLIAAVFHDFNHTGNSQDDGANIRLAIDALMRNILDEDRPWAFEIVSLIQATQYPYVIPAEKLTLSQQILRDADAAQGLDVAWIQQIAFGLAAEWDKSPFEVLKLQAPFYTRLRFHTEWARLRFPRSVVDEKVAEANELLDLLTMEAAPLTK